MAKKISNRGQVTIWIIIAVVLVASIVLFFLIYQEPKLIKPAESEGVFDMQSFLDSCVKEYVEEIVDIIIPQGGFTKPENYKIFDNTKIEYICENIGFYEPCIQQHPLLIREIKGEIGNYIVPRIESECLPELKREIEKRNGEIEFLGPLTLSVDLGEDRVYVNVEKESKITKNKETRKYKEFKFEVINPVYNLASIASEIASQEAQYCYFEYVGYKILYPRYTITKFSTSDSVKIYTIEDTKSKKKMNIAIRGCAVPAGI
ncbi:MAG: hypothetical protein AABX73_02560 [Nanoarchaeota archaeon]